MTRRGDRPGGSKRLVGYLIAVTLALLCTLGAPFDNVARAASGATNDGGSVPESVVRVAAASQPLVVFAAASLKNALDAILTAWQRTTQVATVASYAGTPALALQINNGAPADVFISADEAWMDQLFADQVMRAGTRREVTANRLVLITPAGASLPDDLLPLRRGISLAAVLGQHGRLAIADPDHVPAGRYAKQALSHLGLWDSVADQLATTLDVRLALALVARGEAPLGIVYASDAGVQDQVATVGVFAEQWHAPIRYPAAVVAASRHAKAAQLIEFLVADKAQALFAQHGFTPVGPQ